MNHPQHCKKAIPYSQALRVVERCSTTENRDFHLVNLKEKFEKRNYPTELIAEQFGKAKQEERKDLIFGERKNRRKNKGKVNFIFTYNQTNPPFHMWLRKGKKQLERNDAAKAIGNRIQISYKQPRNLQKIAGGCKVGGVQASPQWRLL